MMQHVQLLKAMNKLRFLEDYLSNHTQNAKISYLVKIAEGIVPPIQSQQQFLLLQTEKSRSLTRSS